MYQFMKKFMDKDFLLHSETSEKLFSIASKQPIFDFHCHLSPKEIYENKQFEDLSVLWLGGDHYKWRVMRSYGIEEKYITGDGTGYEKFKAWAEVLPLCIGNPLYHWTHLELQRFFNIDTLLNSKTADEIWKESNKKIEAGGFTPHEIIRNSNVKALCTTDDPTDTLEYHKLIAADASFDVKILPAFRPDNALNIAAKGFDQWVAKLSRSEGIPIATFTELKEALTRRIEFFAKMGCVASDHAIVYVTFNIAGEAEIDGIFKKALAGDTLTPCDVEKYQTALLAHLAGEYHKNNIAMELHIGALRNNNTKMFEKMGPNTGYDSVHDHDIAEPLSRFLDYLESRNDLPKTILFTQNPKDNYVLVSMLGNFQSPETVSKLQFGSAWWMNDHINGMRRQMTDLANIDVLGTFIGMVTDSRSFLSYPRHEYFRRIFCDMLGTMVEDGEYPDDMDALNTIVSGIAYKNAVKYFGLNF
jgi:glucuronate isomerase